MIIDYSANDAWDFCPGKWYEKYVNKRQMRWPKAQRDDALALGSLVHAGMELWQKGHIIAIPNEVVDEICPTQECFFLAQELVFGYSRAFPEEPWPLILCEEPVLFPLLGSGDSVDAHGYPQEELTGLAKIDSHFPVYEHQTIESGFGQTFNLSPGRWIFEYKTKSPYTPISLYMQQWEMNKQASYQLLAMQHKLAVEDQGETLGGILVNVLEKPKSYVPKRKCLQCVDSYEFATWLPTGTGEYACPVCGHRQKLKSLEKSQPRTPPNFYRILVTRTPEELEFDRQHIIQTGLAMIEMERDGLESRPWTKRNCVTTFPKAVCEFFGPHKNHVDTKELAEYTEVPDYRGLVQLGIEV